MIGILTVTLSAMSGPQTQWLRLPCQLTAV